jgi:nardilysin
MQMYDVIGVVYQYLKLLNQSKPQEWIFKELQDIGNMEFRFAEEHSQDEYAYSLAGSFSFCYFPIEVIPL